MQALLAGYYASMAVLMVRDPLVRSILARTGLEAVVASARLARALARYGLTRAARLARTAARPPALEEWTVVAARD